MNLGRGYLSEIEIYRIFGARRAEAAFSNFPTAAKALTLNDMWNIEWSF